METYIYRVYKNEDGNYLLTRNGKNLICPFHVIFEDNCGEGEVICGDWCPHFTTMTYDVNKTGELLSIVTINCGSEPKAFTIKEDKVNEC